MRIAWFSILPVEEKLESTSSAYVTKLILPELLKTNEVDLYHARYEKYKNYSTGHFLTAYKNHKINPYDIFIYQIEDNPESYFTRCFSGIFPGITLFHSYLFRNRSSIAIADVDPYYDGPIVVRELKNCGLPVFFGKWAYNEYRLRFQQYPTCRSEEIFYPVPQVEVNEFKKENTEFDNSLLTIGLVADTTTEQRAHKILPAISRLNNKIRLYWLTENYSKAKRLCEEFSVKNFEIVEKATPDKWMKLLSRINVAIHPACEHFTNLGPFLQMSISREIPVVIWDFGEGEYVENQYILKIEPGQNESSQLSSILSKLFPQGNSLKMTSTFEKPDHPLANSPQAFVEKLIGIIKESKGYIDSKNTVKLSHIAEAKIEILNTLEKKLIEERSVAVDFSNLYQDLGW